MILILWLKKFTSFLEKILMPEPQANKKKLLLLGGGHAEIPLILAAQELGYYVITTGNARDGLGHPLADKNAFADFDNKEAML